MSLIETPEPVEEAYKIVDYVLVKFEGELWPGQITSMEIPDAKINVMKRSKCGKGWMWPDCPDESWYNIEEIESIIQDPKPISKSRRGTGVFSVPDLANKWGE